MSELKVYLFGNFRLTCHGNTVEVQLGPIAQALLSYLLINRHRTHRRETLATLFWGDYTEKRARHCLNTMLWRLRRLLEPEGVPNGTYLITAPAGEIGFNCESDYWLDVEIFEKGVKRALALDVAEMNAATAHEVEQALRLYTNDLLDGLYDNWALWERERLHRLHLNGLIHLMRYHKHHGAYEKSLACGQEILRIDPLREEVHREMMRTYQKSGRRTLAIQQYQTCLKSLADELGVLPMEETTALYSQIVSPSPNGAHPTTRSIDKRPSQLQLALQQLNQAIADLERAEEQLQQAIQLVKQFK